MSDMARPWPPLVIARTTPTWVKWRDFLLTALMWGLFALMLETEFELFFGRHLERLGLGDFNTEANWSIFFERLRPFLRTIILLTVTLVVAAYFTWRRRHRGLALPTPAPLSIAQEAHDCGLDAEALLAVRDLRICIAHVESDGRLRIEAPPQPL